LTPPPTLIISPFPSIITLSLNSAYSVFVVEKKGDTISASPIGILIRRAPISVAALSGFGTCPVSVGIE